MRYVIWRCPKCKNLKFTTQHSGSLKKSIRRLQCSNYCYGAAFNIKDVVIKIFPYYEEARRYFNKLEEKDGKTN